MYCVEVQGIEWDWFASDLHGHVALLSSAGSGQVPPGMLAHERLIAELLKLAGIQCDEHSARAAAAFGLYAFDGDYNGGPYQRLAIPRVAKTVDELPKQFRDLVRMTVVQGSFPLMKKIRIEQFRY